MRKRKEKAVKVRQYVNSNENDYQFDVCFDIIMLRFCDLRPGDTEWVII